MIFNTEICNIHFMFSMNYMIKILFQNTTNIVTKWHEAKWQAYSLVCKTTPQAQYRRESSTSASNILHMQSVTKGCREQNEGEILEVCLFVVILFFSENKNSQKFLIQIWISHCRFLLFRKSALCISCVSPFCSSLLLLTLCSERNTVERITDAGHLRRKRN